MCPKLVLCCSESVMYEVPQRLEQCGQAKSSPWSALVTVLGVGGSRVTRVGLPGQVYCTLPDPFKGTLKDSIQKKEKQEAHLFF